MIDTIQQRFEEFDRQNPQIYRMLVAMSRQIVRKKRKVGIELLFAQLRWQSAISTESDDDFKLNNNFTSRYARKLIAENPSLSEVFETRAIRRV